MWADPSSKRTRQIGWIIEHSGGVCREMGLAEWLDARDEQSHKQIGTHRALDVTAQGIWQRTAVNPVLTMQDMLGACPLGCTPGCLLLSSSFKRISQVGAACSRQEPTWPS